MTPAYPVRQSMEDLEKLFFVWQDAVEIADSDREITIEILLVLYSYAGTDSARSLPGIVR